MAGTGRLARKISGKVTGKGTNLTKKTRPQKKKISTIDGPGHPAHKDDSLKEIFDIEE